MRLSVAVNVSAIQFQNDDMLRTARQALEAQIALQGVDSTWHLLDGRAREAMIASDVVLLASGTATLEAMLCKRPMVVGYRIAPLSYALMKRMVTARFITLFNIAADEMIAPELIQHDATPERLAGALGALVHGVAGDDANPWGPVRASAIVDRLPATIAALLTR